MKERPILFSGPMVRAILDGKKTQTRRVVKPLEAQYPGYMPVPGEMVDSSILWFRCPETVRVGYTLDCPYGKPGDRLWVRESFQPLYGPEAGATKPNWKTGYGYQVSYPATEGVREYHDEERGLTDRCKPSIHMPRWASRTTLEITKVRVERLKQIKCFDAWAEGIPKDYVRTELSVDESVAESLYTIRKFRKLWDALNDDRGFGWEKNPWVWVIEFKRLEATA